MQLTTVRTFLAVCRLGSLSSAAAELGYTQSAVSRQVAALEQYVGVPLLERRSRGVVPTAAGDAFRHHARAIAAEADRAVRAARDARTTTAPIALGATPSAAAGVVPSALRTVRDEHPAVRWTLVTGLTRELTEAVAAGTLDVAVVTDAPPGLPDDDRVERNPLGTDAMCVIVPEQHPARAARGPLSLADFADATWVEDNEGSEILLRTAAARAGFDPRIDVTAADLTGKAAMVAAGHAVALVPGLLGRALRRDVVAVAIEDAPTRGVYAVTPRGPAPAGTLVRAMIDALRIAVSDADPMVGKAAG
ncbi:LysR family transcriptional regulator [Nocardioides bizhenqiangii]|uniref:LysR family transcriptional regulator n=1 Tax=Nocardioides bizhenqiangii TaxID=3095076 RepID=A0ABZ0ZX42_9ACTN|nr:LysR family transcriptional regulator [Nocardioides sp. HM61]WQQ28426.1 LysR family transcriptional regulator [Nocardioides sp. HM61]